MADSNTVWGFDAFAPREIHDKVCNLGVNFVGAVFLAWLVYMSGHAALNGGAVGQTYMQLATAKMSLPPVRAFFSGVMCNLRRPRAGSRRRR